MEGLRWRRACLFGAVRRTPMTTGAMFVGRVGALAVALGVGMAVTSTQSSAWARPDSPSDTDTKPHRIHSHHETNASDSTPDKDSATESDPTSGPDPASAATTTTRRPPRLRIHEFGSPNLVGRDESRDDTVAPNLTQSRSNVPRPRHVFAPRPNDTAPEPTTLATSKTSTPPMLPTPHQELKSAVKHTITSFAQKAEAVSTPPFVEPRTSVVESVVPATQRQAALVAPAPATGVAAFNALPATIVKTISSVANIVLGSLASPKPGVPQDSPVMWAVLAVVRREFFNQTPEIKSAVSEPNSEGKITISLNQTDGDGDKLNYTATTNGDKGTVAVNADGHTLTYTPKPGATGTDTVTVTASDATTPHIHGLPGLINALSFGRLGDAGHTATTTVTVTLNTPPELSLTADEPDDTGEVTVTAVATDADHNPLTLTITQPAGAKGTVGTPTLVDASTGTYAIVYTPSEQARHAAAGATAPQTDSFTVTITDGHGGTVTKTATVTIDPQNTDPNFVEVKDRSTDSDGTVTGTVVFADTDMDAVTYSGTGKTGKGSVVVDAGGAFTYTPDAGQRFIAAFASGAYTDTFTVTAADGHGGTSTTDVTVTITPAEITASNAQEALTAAQAAIAADTAALAEAQAAFSETLQQYLASHPQQSDDTQLAAFTALDAATDPGSTLSPEDLMRLNAQAQLIAAAANSGAGTIELTAAVNGARVVGQEGTSLPPDLVMDEQFAKLKAQQADVDKRKDDLQAALNASAEAQAQIVSQTANGPVYQKVSYTVNADHSVSGQIYFVGAPDNDPIKIYGTGIDGSYYYFDESGNSGGKFFIPAPTSSSYSSTVTVTAYAVDKYENPTQVTVTLDRSTPTVPPSVIPPGASSLGTYAGFGQSLQSGYNSASAKYEEAEAQHQMALEQQNAELIAATQQARNDINSQLTAILSGMSANQAAFVTAINQV
ncbi:Ig-like domain-containing protein [Mycolicibacterium stellerae]|uniref:Ig-like domain-containing protein n=1 Tax=Mycolicibacterium stellerae TaxID=2358193 RepID=UPI0038996141